MKKLLLLVLFPLLAFANGIDDNCSKFVFKSAPIVAADQFICHKQYGVAYRYETKTAYYTVEYLESSDTGDVPRSNDFRPDLKVPLQYSATVLDYKGTTDECGGSRCDRGHLSPSQNFSSCVSCVSQSFYFSNIVPQNYKNNQIIWKYLETKVRTYVQKNNSVYVITGPVYTKSRFNTIGDGVAVPYKLFKVIIDSKTGKSIAFMMDNKHIPVSDLNGKVVTLEDIEQATGITFDKSLDKKTSASYQSWFSF